MVQSAVAFESPHGSRAGPWPSDALGADLGCRARDANHRPRSPAASARLRPCDRDVVGPIRAAVACSVAAAHEHARCESHLGQAIRCIAFSAPGRSRSARSSTAHALRGRTGRGSADTCCSAVQRRGRVYGRCRAVARPMRALGRAVADIAARPLRVAARLAAARRGSPRGDPRRRRTSAVGVNASRSRVERIAHSVGVAFVRATHERIHSHAS